MGLFGKIGGGFKWLGGKLLGVLRRGETLFAIKLAADLLPIPALDKIVYLVWKLDGSTRSGKEKMVVALEEVIPILEEYGIVVEKESELRFIIELALKIMEGKARAITE